MRVDAQRNHDQILDAARELFATEGTRVSVEAIAKYAGVGVGTVNRHFPTKEGLIDAVILRFCEPMVDALDRAVLDDDPSKGLEQFFNTTVEYLAANRALSEEMREMHDRMHELPELTQVKDRMTARLEQLLDQGQASGHLRPDVTIDDLRLVLAGLAQTAQRDDAHATPAAHTRFVHLVMDGIRTAPRRPL